MYYLVFLPDLCMLGYHPFKEYLSYADTSDQIAPPVTLWTYLTTCWVLKFIYSRKFPVLNRHYALILLIFQTLFTYSVIYVCMYVCMYIYSKHFTELRNIIIHDHDEAFVYCTNRQTGNVRERV